MQELARASALLNSKSGRDKLYKTLQYLLKLILELAHFRRIGSPWLPHLKRVSLRLSQARALFRLGSFVQDAERMYFLVTKQAVSWNLIESIITCFTVLISNFFDSIVTFNGIVRRDTGFSLHYSTVFWLLGIFGDIIRYSRGLHQAFRAEAKWKTQILPESQKSPEGGAALISEPGIDIKAVRKAKWDNFIGIAKSACDSVTATSILYPVAVGRYRLFVCSCGLFAGSVGLIQNWFAIKV